MGPLKSDYCVSQWLGSNRPSDTHDKFHLKVSLDREVLIVNIKGTDWRMMGDLLRDIASIVDGVYVLIGLSQDRIEGLLGSSYCVAQYY